MSKQSENKENQGFQKKCPCCGNCVNFMSETVKEPGYYPGQIFVREKNLRCGIGGFAVGKSNWCKLHEFNKKGNI